MKLYTYAIYDMTNTGVSNNYIQQKSTKQVATVTELLTKMSNDIYIKKLNRKLQPPSQLNFI